MAYQLEGHALITCQDCGRQWLRIVRPGAKPQTCEACRLERRRTSRSQWVARNPEGHRDAQQKYREENREDCNRRVRDYYARNRKAEYTRTRRWRLENPERVAASERKSRERLKERDPVRAYLRKKEQHLRYCYGLTLDGYDEMLVAQDGCCAICRVAAESRFDFHVDHDHDTGRVRGLLCKRCNPMVGLSLERPETLRMAAEYLEREAQ